MSATTPGEITELLIRVRQGDRQAEDALAELIKPELDQMASIILRHEYRGYTMETGDLVNDIYLKLKPGLRDYNDSTHFKAYAAWLMHRHLISRARKRLVEAKHYGQRAPLEHAELVAGTDEAAAIEFALLLDRFGQAVAELKEKDERAAQVVVLKLGGLTHEEIAHTLDISLSTVKREWNPARAWIATRLGANTARLPQ